jgi:acetylornithine deacetylase/succinyl-diaminopimelate desuccinylase-like protein
MRRMRWIFTFFVANLDDGICAIATAGVEGIRRRNHAAKWTYAPFSATRNGGYVYRRGTVDDKDNVTAALMTAAKFLEQVKKVINDPAVEVAWTARDVRPGSAVAKLDSQAFKALETNVTKHYKAPLLPTMGTGATDMAYLRSKGIQCYGIGPATDAEDGPLGFGAHSDQERILEGEILRFARFNFDVVLDLVRAK